MVKAASDLKIHFNTLKKRALEYNCYKPNPGLKGGNKKVNPKISLVEILEGKHPSFQTYKLKLRLYKEGIFENKCSICGIDSWTNKPLNMELDHINGDRTDHKLDNLRILCPNCHSQTETYRSKNRN
jgi:5-methylcytosine-specific restriction endonuclease McrA